MTKLAATALFALIATAVGAQVLDRTVATVRLTRTATITRSELASQIALFEQQLGRTLNRGERVQILDAMVNDVLLLQAADRSAVRASQEEVENYLAAQRLQWSQMVGTQLSDEQFALQVEQQTGAPFSEYVQNVTSELRKLKYVRQTQADLFARSPEVTDAEIRAVYDEQATAFTNPAMVRFHHVYADIRNATDERRSELRRELETFTRRLRSGALSFDELASIAVDSEHLQAEDFGYLVRNDTRAIQLLGRSFVDAVFAQQQGNVHGVLESRVALHIVSITDRRPARVLGLDDPIFPGQSVTVRAQIRSALVSQRENVILAQAVEAAVALLRQEGDVTVLDANIP